MPLFKQLKDVMGFVDTQTQEDQEINKPYLTILTVSGEYDEEDTMNDSYMEYSAIKFRGRRVVFDYFVDQLGNYDLLRSYVMSGKIPLGSEVTLYTFLRLCIERYFAKSTQITVDDLDVMAWETSNADPSKVNLDILYQRETGQRSR